MSSDENFAARLREAMTARRVRQAELASRLETSQSTVSRWLGGAVPHAPMLKRLSAQLSVRPEWLSAGVAPMDSDRAKVFIAHDAGHAEFAQSIREEFESPRSGAPAQTPAPWVQRRIEHARINTLPLEVRVVIEALAAKADSPTLAAAREAVEALKSLDVFPGCDAVLDLLDWIKVSSSAP